MAPSRVSVIDGRATLPEFAFGRASRLDQVNLELSAAEPGGAVALDGTLALNGQPLRVDARFGRLTQERSSTLRLELSTEGLGDAGASTATFGGVVWWRADAPGLRGELTVAGADARSTIGALRTALGQEIAADAALAGGAVPGDRAGRARERSPRAVRCRARARRNGAGRPAGCDPGRRAGDRPGGPRAAVRASRGSVRRCGWPRGLRHSLPWPRRCAARSIWRWARSTTPACRCSACARPCS